MAINPCNLSFHCSRELEGMHCLKLKATGGSCGIWAFFLTMTLILPCQSIPNSVFQVTFPPKFHQKYSNFALGKLHHEKSSLHLSSSIEFHWDELLNSMTWRFEPNKLSQIPQFSWRCCFEEWRVKFLVGDPLHPMRGATCKSLL